MWKYKVFIQVDFATRLQYLASKIVEDLGNASYGCPIVIFICFPTIIGSCLLLVTQFEGLSWLVYRVNWSQVVRTRRCFSLKNLIFIPWPVTWFEASISISYPINLFLSISLLKQENFFKWIFASRNHHSFLIEDVMIESLQYLPSFPLDLKSRWECHGHYHSQIWYNVHGYLCKIFQSCQDDSSLASTNCSKHFSAASDPFWENDMSTYKPTLHRI